MNSFIKKIFEDKVDDLVHLQFEKFGRGDYKNKALINAKKVKDYYNISTTAEFGNELVRAMAEKLGENSTRVTGVIVSTRDLSGEIEFKNKKQFMGVKQYVIDSDIKGRKIIELCDKLPRVFFGLSFKVGDDELKIKPKAPKSAKPGSKSDDKPKVDFIKLKTKNIDIVKGLIFEKQNFKFAEINHTFAIKEIILPKGVADPKQMREMAKRKGKIIRQTNFDGLMLKEEKDFVA